MRTGIATTPLHGGHCPKWLFKKMTKLSRGIALAIVEEFGPEELLKRLSDPVWFQSLGCVIGFDFHSSGLTTTTMGALKEGIRGLEDELGLFICGGKGRTSRKTPAQIQKWGQRLKLDVNLSDLVYTSKMSAKVDSNLIQDGFNLYHHNFIFTKDGKWVVIQQGLNSELNQARRYHWLSSNINDLVEEPHSGITSDAQVEPLNLTAKQSDKNRTVSLGLVTEEPKTFLNDIKLISTKKDHKKDQLNQNQLQLFGAGGRPVYGPRFRQLEMSSTDFHYHPVVNEKFNLKRLKKTILFAKSQQPQDFEQLLAVKGVGAKTVRALSLVAEIIYGAKPSYEDPARYSFAHGGKDGIPRAVEPSTLDSTIEVLERGIKRSKVSDKEKDKAQQRLEQVLR